MPQGSQQWAPRWLVVPALVLSAMLFIALGRIDAGLGRIEAPDHPAATWSSLVALDPLSEQAAADARTAWCVWFNAMPDRRAVAAARGPYDDPGPGPRVETCLNAFTSQPRPATAPQAGGDEARLLIRWYVGLDAVLVLLYVWLLYAALTALRARIPCGPPASQPDDPTSTTLCWATKRSRLVILTCVLVSAEVAEDTGQWMLTGRSPSPGTIDFLSRLIGWAALAKWAFVGLALLLLIVLTLHTGVLRTVPWRDFVVVRVQLFVSAVLLLFIVGVGTDQVPDALLGLLDHWATAIATPVAVFLLSLLLWRSVHRVALTRDSALAPVHQWWVAGAAVVCAVLGFWLRSLLGLAMVLGFVFVLSWIAGAPFRLGDAAVDPGADVAKARAQGRAALIVGDPRRNLRSIARWLAALPLLALGVFAVRSAVVPAIVGPRRWSAVLLVVLGLLAAAVGFLLPYLLDWAERHWSWAKEPDTQNRRDELYVVLAALFGAFAVGCTVTLVTDRAWNLAVWAGPMAVLMVFLGVVLVLLNELQLWSERATPVAGFRALKLDRTPVFVLLIAWFLLGSLVDAKGHHQVRVREEAGAPVLVDVDLDTAFQRWAAANCATVPSPADAAAGPGTKQPLPLVIVAASGGGIRAAYWTASVLDWLFPPGPVTPAAGASCTPSDGRAPVFAVSGVSGGSLGSISWIARTSPDAPDGDPSHRKVFGQDHLSGALAWMAFVDLPRAFVGFPGKDRAAVLEQSWEHRQKELEQPFYATWQPSSDGSTTTWTPLALLNGAAAESGCRVLTSALQLGAFDQPVGSTSCRQRPEESRQKTRGPRPAQAGQGSPTLIDLRSGFLCGKQDVNRSTAALLSARFPFITPSGRLTGDACHHTGAGLSVIDGGYVDATGSMTATDLREQLEHLSACHNQRVAGGTGGADCKPAAGTAARPVEVVLVQIDNGYTSVASAPAPGRPRELLVPTKGKAAAVSAAESTVRQRALEAFGCPDYLTFANVRGPGAQAPLGWVLSLSAKKDLDDQLARLKGEGAGNVSPLTARLAAAQQACGRAGMTR
ncbi:hypothetical protein [Streptomyces sp. NBC_01276]|uniref:hypothetical protein n=1 Tax=Streptomyces sp. NBC_01276 TaxID=2903808 RepID=UPI00352E5EBF